MHIGFDISQTGSGKAGCGYFAFSLIRSMLEIAPEHCYSLFPSFGDFYFDMSMPFLNPYSGKKVHYGPRHLSYESAKYFWARSDVDDLLVYPDILHSNNFWCPTQSLSSRLIYTLYDLGFTVDPNWTTENNRIGCFEGVFRSSIMADWIVAISRSSRDHYLRLFPHFSQDRIRVIYPSSRFTDPFSEGIRPHKSEMLLPGQFWLSVGTMEPRKNYRRLAEAYARYLALGGESMPLVIAGGKGWLMNEFQEYLEMLGILSNIIMIGYVSDENLIWLYRNCYANLYPSLFEGFGLPILEGMQFGAPTVASNTTSIPEVTRDAAILIAPENIEDWAQTMVRLVRDKKMRAQLAEASLERAKCFSWKVSASSLLDLYQEAIDFPKRPQPL